MNDSIKTFYSGPRQIGGGMVKSGGDSVKEFYSGPIQAGGGLPVYVGARRQIGGGFLSGLARFAVPIIKYLAPKALNFAANTINDVVVDGKSLKSAALARGMNEIKSAVKRKNPRPAINKRRKRAKKSITSPLYIKKK